jgi:hypothetical protein
LPYFSFSSIVLNAIKIVDEFFNGIANADVITFVTNRIHNPTKFMEKSILSREFLLCQLVRDRPDLPIASSLGAGTPLIAVG